MAIQRRVSRLPQWFPKSISSYSIGSMYDVHHDNQVYRAKRILTVDHVYWVTEPLKEAGMFSCFSPRTLPRILADRAGRGLEGPATWEVGHSYALVRVTLSEPPGVETMYRLNWGAGRIAKTNLTILEQDWVPPESIGGERLEGKWPATCSGEELYSMLREWDGREYDVAPSNNANCHHFIQDLIQRCTAESGHELRDRLTN